MDAQRTQRPEMLARPIVVSEPSHGFDVEEFLDLVGVAKSVRTYRKNRIIFAQGDPARNVLFIRNGLVKRTVVSPSGKEAIVGILGPGDFFGDWCLSEQPVCIATAVTLELATIVTIGKGEMLRALRTEHRLTEGFIAYLLARTVRVEEKLIDQLFNSAEQRLARALLRLGRYGYQAGQETCIPRVSQQTLAEMIGTTRGHVNHFMNKFRRLGFVDYSKGELRIRRSLVEAVPPN